MSTLTLHAHEEESVASAAPLVAYFDGLCEPRNPGGWACGGWWVDTDPPVAGWRVYGSGPDATNNQGEYRAALDALRAAYASGWRGAVVLRGDSQVVIRQVTGAWRCQSPTLRPLRDAVLHGATFFRAVTYEWVPREENERADALSRRAYAEATASALHIRDHTPTRQEANQAR